MGLLSGAAAMSFRKGSERHRVAGEVFVISMLVMGGCGFLLALLKRQTGNVFGGLLTLYMIMTAWLTARRRPNQTGVFDWLTMVLGLAIGATLLNLGMLVVTGRSTSQPGVPEGMYFVLGSIPILGGAGDLRMLARGGICGECALACSSPQARSSWANSKSSRRQFGSSTCLCRSRSCH